MVLASFNPPSGLYCVNFPFNFPATSCLPFGDQLTHEIPSPGGKVDVSNFEPSVLIMYKAILPFVKTTANIVGMTGFHDISLIATPGGVIP